MNPELEARTLALAAAVEMLYIALALHKRLVHTTRPAAAPASAANSATNPETESHAAEGSPTEVTEKSAQNAVPPPGHDTAERTFLGSTILAGDYCFSRASQLAAATEHPHVVAHFAQTLQTLSEGLLREQFNPQVVKSSAPFDENQTLLFAGVEATLLLHGQTRAQHSAIMRRTREFSEQILAHMPAPDNGHSLDRANGNDGSLQADGPGCASHWDALHSWWHATATP